MSEDRAQSEDFGLQQAARTSKAEHDLIALGIAAAAVIMFVGTGGAVVSSVINAIQGVGVGPDKLLVNAMLLNIALTIFGWRRYKDLAAEVGERRQAEEQARLLAQTDALTGCLNRRSIGPAANQLIAESQAKGQVVAFMMMDIDHFKQINDFNGHSTGDRILLEVARRIKAALPEGGLVSRLGGDEFACALAFDPKQASTIDRLANAILTSVAQPIEANGLSVESSLSLGIARSDIGKGGNAPTQDAHALLHMADIAMYSAKKQGRNRHCWFEASMENELRYRSELEAGIRRGIPLGEFVPYYEQQVDLDTGELTGFEMLARWNSPTLGLVGPDVFIPISEEIGTISDLSESVISQALQDAKAWDPRLTLSVNISPLQLRDPWFAQKLLKLLVEANFSPNRLEIEVTESCLHENIGMVRTLITSLKNQGIRVSLDDFGTGYSSLAQLRALPFDRIKIDRSFVTSLPECADNAAVIEAITSLGRALGLPITAEGVETADVLSKIREFGAFKGQGYFYGQPQSAQDTLATLAGLNLLRDDTAVEEADPAEHRLAGNG